MTTIFTDDFAYDEVDITLDDYELGNKGRDLIFSAADDKEIRVKLSDSQLDQLAEVLELNGHMMRVQTDTPNPLNSPTKGRK